MSEWLQNTSCTVNEKLDYCYLIMLTCERYRPRNEVDIEQPPEVNAVSVIYHWVRLSGYKVDLHTLSNIQIPTPKLIHTTLPSAILHITLKRPLHQYEWLSSEHIKQT